MVLYRNSKVIVGLAAALLLSACSVESKSWVNSNRVEVRNDQFSDTFETSSLNESTLHAIGGHYYRFGNGPMNVVVSYDPSSRINTKANAEKALQEIRTELNRNGVSDVRGTINPMKGSGDVSQTLVNFSAITASAPTGCKMMPGYNNPAEDIPNSTNLDADYKYGCTVESLLARQVARPADLMGKQGFETNADGRRQERVLSTRGYYGDKPNADLNGEKASDK